MKLSIAIVCTIVVAFVATTAMVDAKPALIRRVPKDKDSNEDRGPIPPFGACKCRDDDGYCTSCAPAYEGIYAHVGTSGNGSGHLKTAVGQHIHISSFIQCPSFSTL
ncbi:hypothetical protein BDF19DRAFT_420983 [Syncephalis fuscata]|nr:hypothetical protein BDF19DRAFT_420983 [Syncephalis fuscata]